MTIRLLVGLVFVGAGLFKLAFAGRAVADFERWGFSPGELAVPAVGAFELGCGALLLLGVRVRVAALLLLADMVAVLLTAGRIDGGYHVWAPLVLGPLLVVVLVRERTWR